MRTMLGIILGVVLVFPGILLLQWVTYALGLYDDVTFTDGCLVMIIILLSVLLVRGGFRTDTGEPRASTLAGPSSRNSTLPRRPRDSTRPLGSTRP